MDFNEYAKNNTYSDKNENYGQVDKNLFDLVNSLASRFDGKNQSELLMAIYEEAKKGKRQGTLTNAEIDNFAMMLSPMLDDKQRKVLNKIVKELKKI
ncbi:MAG: hypothetical protein IKB67_05765 [Clostridia bacterium]|nr:hypothetical protein [Clostridia bacterium]